MTKRITQPTFDCVVKENMEDFNLNLEDALKEAILQFNQQGVTLDNIDITGGVGMTDLKSSIESISSFLKKENIDEDSLSLALDKIKKLCSSKDVNHVRNRTMILQDGCLYSLYQILKCDSSSKVIRGVLDTVIHLTKSDDFRDFFEPGGSETLAVLFKRFYEPLDLSTLQLVLKLAHTVAKSENNKVELMKTMAENITVVLTNPVIFECVAEWRFVVQESCLLLRELCIHNDNRVEMSCAFENGRFFIKNTSLLVSLTKLSALHVSYPGIASCSLAAVKTMATNEEAVAAIAKCNIIEVVMSTLVFYQKISLAEDEATRASNRQLIKSCFGLMRNLCVDDGRKSTMVDSGAVEIILFYLNNPDYTDDHSIVESGIACLATIALRSVPNSTRITELGGVPVIIASMRKHSTHACLQKQCCAVIRNMAARYPASHAALLDAGAEGLLRRAGTMPGAVDEAYSALRDLKCDVKMVKLGANGKIENAFESFGVMDETGNIVAGVKKLNFNPVFEETTGLSTVIESESRAPFKPDF